MRTPDGGQAGGLRRVGERRDPGGDQGPCQAGKVAPVLDRGYPLIEIRGAVARWKPGRALVASRFWREGCREAFAIERRRPVPHPIPAGACPTSPATQSP